MAYKSGLLMSAPEKYSIFVADSSCLYYLGYPNRICAPVLTITCLDSYYYDVKLYTM